jgi:hypothetical protein
LTPFQTGKFNTHNSLQIGEVPPMNQTPVQSSIGEVIDVATTFSRKLRVLGLFWSLIALSTFLLINYLIIQALNDDNPILSTEHPASLMGALLVPLVCWYALGAAVQRFHAAATTERYFRTGPGGVSVCLPDDHINTFLFSFRTVKFDLPWEQVKTWYPYVQSINGIPTERAIIFETLEGRKLKIKTYHFRENQKQIAANITRAKSLPTLALAKNAANSGEDEARTFALPPRAGDLSLQIKKKKESVKQIDLCSIHSSQRGASIERITDGLEAKMSVICPHAAGFKITRKRYQPFREWKNVFGIRLFVRRGLLDGYEIQVEPADSEARTLTISMCPSSLIGDIRRYVSMAVGAAFVLISLKWIGVISYWLGDFARLTPLVLLALGTAILGLSAGILEVPIRLVRLLISDSENEAIQKREIRVGIREMAV